MDAVLSIMAIGRAPSLVREVGLKLPNDVLEYDGRDVLDARANRLFADMAVRASGDQIPLGRTQWRILAPTTDQISPFRGDGYHGLGRAYFAL